MSSASTAPADSIFAVMSTQNESSSRGSSGSSTPTIPRLGMMIDRTSFDETDDFGVNQTAKMNITEYVAGPPVIMRDGKVRRRLRWRPKGMAKRPRAPPVANNTNINNKGSKPPSSNSSVVSSSNASQTSRLSKKSMHSFASTETACINNTTKKNKMFPLPRPSIPVRLDGEGGMATIGNEGDFVHARISQGATTRSSSPSTTLFAAAYVHLDDNEVPTSQQHPPSKAAMKGDGSHGKSTSLDSKSDHEVKAISNAGYRRNDLTSAPPSSRRNGLPPRFHRPMNKIVESPVSTPSTSAGTTSPTDSIESSLEDYEDGHCSPVPVPVLSGDEVEVERRLDLRIPRTPSSITSQSVRQVAIGEDGVEPLSIYELRYDEDRQDKQQTLGKSLSTSNSEQSTPTRSAPAVQSVVSDSFISKFRATSRKTHTKPVQQILSSTSSLSSRSQDLRFSMSNTSAFVSPRNATMPRPSARQETHDTSTPSIPKAHTCPVDVDNGTFLEAEKNLQAIHEMASEHLRQGESAEALEVFEEILRGQLARYGEDHHRVGTALHNIGIVLMRRGDYARALEVYKEAVRVRKNALDPFHPDVAASLAQLGVAYMERSKYRKAIGAFREALKIRRKCLGNDHPKVGKILNNIGCSLFELDELEVAKVAFEEALDIQRNLLRNPPNDLVPISESSLLSIASTQSNIASIKLYRGQFDEAIVDLEEALLIQQCALGDDHPLALRTQESLAWMERSRKEASTPVSVDLLTQLTGTLTSKGSRDLNASMVDSLYSRFDLACRGWDGYDTEESMNDYDSEMSPRE